MFKPCMEDLEAFFRRRLICEVLSIVPSAPPANTGHHLCVSQVLHCKVHSTHGARVDGMDLTWMTIFHD